MAEEFKTITNQYGISIVCCCATCDHNLGIISPKARKCELTDDRNDGNGGVEVPRSYCCKCWKLRSVPVPRKRGYIDFGAAGKGGGEVKRKEYLLYALELSKGRAARESFTEKHGTIYYKL